MSSSSGLTFKLHPLVILNISDHYTRIKAQNMGEPSRVLGCVLGVQSGRTVEIFNSFELKYNEYPVEELRDSRAENLPSGVYIDRGFLNTKMEQYKKVFSQYDVLGWYSSGTESSESDIEIHKTFMDINESPIYVLLNPAINPAGKDLPIKIYESELHMVEGFPSLMFASTDYTIETVEAERISVDHVAHIKPSDGSSSSTQLAAHLTGLHSAIEMLNSRVRVLENLLTLMMNNELPIDHSLLRQISSLVRRLPAMNSTKFQNEFLTEYNDGLLMTYLASITKGTNALNELINEYNIVYDKPGRLRGRPLSLGI